MTSPLRVLCSVYWYAFQTIASMMAVEAILSKSFDVDIPLGWLAAGFAALQGGVALLGYGGVSRLSGITLPLKLIIFMILIFWLVQNGGPAAAYSHIISYQAGSWKWAVGLAWVNGIFSNMLTLMTDAADFSRYTRKIGHMEAEILPVFLWEQL
ncbi:cytosine permease [Sansalvadorimonas sp. 2012CJ34-2]|uniref:Cytosine permease n=1 Tax=Parendozoicomonas callyspongiae TaxID=2942213 RepID=A0ABT0PHM4_9GAMM|nr:cytosine permease [Sansalvadorimonas sp. 2012CJ34-2]